MVQDLITPQTIERTTLNYKGATLGFKVDPSDIDMSLGFNRKSEIDKLYMTGAWSENGFSMPSVVNSGNLVAGDILGIKTDNLFINPKHRLERLSQLVEQGE